jgi:hypothetical protein
VWAWKRGSGEFTPYDPEISARIEGAHAVGDKGVIIFLQRSAAYRIDFGNMCQINLGDQSKRRSIKRLNALDATVEKPRRTSRMDGAILATAHADAAAAGIEVKKNGTVKGYHLTTPSAATSIIQSSEFHASASGLIGPFVYFANTPEDCVGKAQAVRSLDEGALLTAQVDLGYSLVVTAQPSPAVQSFLGITTWNDLTTAKLEKAGCQSVYAKAPGIINRDEFAVPIGGAPQVTAIRLSGYHKKSSPTSSALVAVPFWQWPAWVHNLANAVQIDDAAVEAVSPSTPISQPMGESYGVKINSAGRPVHSDGKFMSYAEARRRGWGFSSNPTGPTKKDGTPDMRYAANRDTFLSPRASSSGSARYQVSSNPTGPTKKDGTPDMRYAANRAASSTSWFSNHGHRGHGHGGRHGHAHGHGGHHDRRGGHHGHAHGHGGHHSSHTPTKKDGTPDMRYAANRDTFLSPRASSSGSARYQVSSNPTGPTKKDGTPDMRYAANRAAASTSWSSAPSYSSYCSPSGGGGGFSPWSMGGGGGGSSYLGSACYSVSSNPTGPMKLDGTPDMRYSANRG